MAMSDDLSNLNTALSGVVVPVGFPAIVKIYTSADERTVTTAELPCYLILWNKPVATHLMTFGTVSETREYQIHFLYKPVAQGTIHEDITDTMNYIQPTLNALYAHLTLYSTVLGQYSIQYVMPKELPFTWAGTKYIGFTTVVRVIQQRAITLGS